VRGQGSHRFDDHTAEVLLRVEAPSLPDLYAEAARGLAELLADDPATVPLGPPERVDVEADDREALLVRWLDELVFIAETTGRVFPSVQILSVGDRALSAAIRGGAPHAFRTAVKAATWHRLSVAERDGAFVATVVLDV
jgi:SHS2 domain-containing protein